MGSRTGKQQASPYAEKPWLRHYDYWVPERTNFPRQPLSQMLNLAAAHCEAPEERCRQSLAARTEGSGGSEATQ
jgi:hypothetical protein